MLPIVDFENSFAVAAFVQARLRAMYPAAGDAWLQQLFNDINPSPRGTSSWRLPGCCCTTRAT
jgi:hypothetical protein